MRFTDQFMRVLLSIPWATVVSVYGREKAEKIVLFWSPGLIKQIYTVNDGVQLFYVRYISLAT